MSSIRALHSIVTLLLFAVTGALSGCSSLSDGRPTAISGPHVSGSPCKVTDWFEIGRIDGLNGVSIENSVYVGRCRALGFDKDQELYTAGWERGRIDYCTPERAFDAGRAGESYSGICPKNLEEKFLEKYQTGAEIAALEKKNATLEIEVDHKLSEFSALEMSVEATSPTPAKSILDEMNKLKSTIQKIRDDLSKNTHQIELLEKTAL